MKRYLALLFVAIILAAGCVTVAVAGNSETDQPECAYNGNCLPPDGRPAVDPEQDGNPNNLSGPGA